MKLSGYLVGLWFVCASLASAQENNANVSASARDEAGEHFRRGTELFLDEAYPAALVEMKRAYELSPDYRVLYNIGQTNLALHDYLGATRSFEQYLQQGGSAVPQARRTQVEKELASLRERVGRIRIRVNVEGAEVFIDEERIGVAPLDAPLLANVGTHRVVARNEFGASDARTVDVAGGETVDVSLELSDSAPRTIVVREAEGEATQPADVPWSTRKKSAIATWAAGGALLVGGAITGVLALKAQQDLDELLETGNVNQRDVQNDRDRVHTLAITTDALLITGAASALTGTLLWLLDRPREKSDTAPASKPVSKLHWSAGPTSLHLQGEF